MRKRGKILFGVLNWGLGHATRSIPIIQKLLKNDYEIVLASDGQALDLLKKEFPALRFEILPAYDIRYSRHPLFFSFKLLQQTPHIWRTMQIERQIARELVDKHQVNIIISDNRFGFRDERVHNIYITHQLQVMSGRTTALSTYLHAKIYDKFDEIWVPDYAGGTNLSGKLGHLSGKNPKIKYIGSLHRLQKQNIPQKYEVLAILSGPEPQRSLLEDELRIKLSKLPLKTAIVQGLVQENRLVKNENGIDIYNYLLQEDLQKLINASEVIISRPGYTSVMDLLHLSKKVLWVPTPGQKEQEYLADYLGDKYNFPVQKQGKLHLNKKFIQELSPTEISLEDLPKEDVVRMLKMIFRLI